MYSIAFLIRMVTEQQNFPFDNPSVHAHEKVV